MPEGTALSLGGPSPDAELFMALQHHDDFGDQKHTKDFRRNGDVKMRQGGYCGPEQFQYRPPGFGITPYPTVDPRVNQPYADEVNSSRYDGGELSRCDSLDTGPPLR